MKFKRYMLEFERFNLNNLEESLELRNADFVRDRMTYTAKIKMEDHLKWFSSINNNNNFYFLVRLYGEAIGVINIKDFDTILNKAELGIFFGKEKIIHSMYPIICAFTLQDFASKLLKIEHLFTKVKKGQKDIIKFNEIMGLEFDAEFDDYFIYKLNEPKAEILTKRYRKAAFALSIKINNPEVFQFEFDENNKREFFFKDCLHNLSLNNQKMFEYS